jgi:hypothetical protein
MRRPSIRNPLFRRRRFCGEVIVLCVRWYLRFKLSYREMAEIAKELGGVGGAEHDPALGGAVRGRLQSALASM